MADTQPTVQTDEATDITRTTAKLHGTLLDMGTAPPIMEQVIAEPWGVPLPFPSLALVILEEWTS